MTHPTTSRPSTRAADNKPTRPSSRRLHARGNAKAAPLVRGWRWKIVAGPPLPFNWVLPVGEAARDMAQEARFVQSGSRRLPLCLHGPPGGKHVGRRAGSVSSPAANGRDHPHAFWLAEDADGDGRIDHILVHANSGFDPAAIRTLAACHQLVLPGIGSWQLMAQWMGWQGEGGLYGPSLNWVSRSPCFPVRGVHRLDLRERLARELRKRRLPAPETIELLGQDAVLAGQAIDVDDFHCERRNGEAASAHPKAAFVRLVFNEPVTGPLSLGHGAHFGLGQFAPQGE